MFNHRVYMLSDNLIGYVPVEYVVRIEMELLQSPTVRDVI